MLVFSSFVAIASLAVGLVQAEPTPTRPHVARGGSSSSCDSNYFSYSVFGKNTCLPYGGPSTPPTSPQGTTCPSTHYWNDDEGCCTPHYPNPPAQPSCPSYWSWDSSRQCCTKTSSSTPAPSKPSGYKRSKRNFPVWDSTTCPWGLTTCPILINGMLSSDTECVDTLADLTSCGGCTSMKKGADCSKIDNATLSTCQGGQCVVEECAKGFKPSDDESTCVAY